MSKVAMRLVRPLIVSVLIVASVAFVSYQKGRTDGVRWWMEQMPHFGTFALHTHNPTTGTCHYAGRTWPARVGDGIQCHMEDAR